MSIEAKLNEELRRIVAYLNKDLEKKSERNPSDIEWVMPKNCGQTTSNDSSMLYTYFFEKLMEDYEKYAGHAFVESPWGEFVFHEHMGYFDEPEGNENAGTTSDEFGSRLDANGNLPVSASSLNLLINAYRWFKVFLPQIKNVKESSDPDTYELRKFIVEYCLALKTHLSNMGQFTYMGERFILQENSWSNPDLYAVPFTKAGSLSSIDSIRLIEKIENHIKKIEDSNNKEKVEFNTTINVAAFGTFCDKPAESGQLHNIEKLASEGYFKDKDGIVYDVKITYFTLKKSDFSTLWFEEETHDENNMLAGNLLATSFMKEVGEKFDFICLLDMGCFYSDTNVFKDAHGDTVYEAIRNSESFIRYEAKHNSIRSIDISTYEDFYFSYIKWVEKEFYRVNHSYEFNPRLFVVLNNLKATNDKIISVYSYMSRDRGRALSSIMRHRELCKGEYYNGRYLITYDWSILSTLIGDYLNQRNKELLGNSTGMKHNLLVINLWKIIKSMGDDFYSKEFIGYILKLLNFNDKKTVDDDSCFDFIEFARDTVIVFDYSEIKNNHVVYDIVCLEPEKYQKSYTQMSRNLVMAMIKLAFEPSCYEKCASEYCKEILINAMIVKSISIEHLVFTYMIDCKPFWRNDIKFTLGNIDNQAVRESMPKKERPTLERMHIRDNLALYEAIDRIDHKITGNTDFALESLEEYLPEIDGNNEGNNRPTSRDILRSIHKACEKLGFVENKLYECARWIY